MRREIKVGTVRRARAVVGFCRQCCAPTSVRALACDRCGAALNQSTPRGSGPDTPYQPGYIVELSPSSPATPPTLAWGEPRAPERAPSAAPVPPADAADRCLKCKARAAGARYRFFVTRRQSLSRAIIHEERAFICDRCARARLRFAPLVVLLLWVPVLVLAALITRLWLSVLLLLTIHGLMRLAWRQLRAIRYRLYHHPPYSGAVARLAIELRKREVLRSLHLFEADVTFRTEADVTDRQAELGEGEETWQGRFKISDRTR